MVDSNAKFKDFEQITEANKMATAVALDQLCSFKYCYSRTTYFSFIGKKYGSELH